MIILKSCSNPRFSVFIIIHYLAKNKQTPKTCLFVKKKHYHVASKLHQSLPGSHQARLATHRNVKMEVSREEIQLDCLCATGESLLNRLNSFQLDGLGKKKQTNLKERNGKGGGICLKKKGSRSFKLPY